MCLKHFKKMGVTGTQQAGGRVIDEVGGSARNQAMQGLGEVRFYIQLQWETTEGFGVRETHNHSANGWMPEGAGQ